jgi:nucleotide-binding universal stress UspA family protein
MVRKIIAGWDGGDRSPDALRFAAVLARATGAELIVAYAYRYDPPFHSGAPDVRLELRSRATQRLAPADDHVPYGMRATMRAVESRSAVQGLHDLAENEHADLIVVGATMKGSLELHAVGSVAERLLRSAPCAVAVAPRGYAGETRPGLHVIGVAYDGSAESIQALDVAADLAARSGAAIKLIGVAEPASSALVAPGALSVPRGDDAIYRDLMYQRLESAADSLPPELRAQVVPADGDPAPEIIERAGILSLLVMGSRGYGPLRRALLGSVSAPVLRAAPCPVLVVPRAAGEAAAVATAAEASG